MPYEMVRFLLMLSGVPVAFVLTVIATLVFGWLSKDYISSFAVSMSFMLGISLCLSTNLTRRYLKRVLRGEDVELTSKESSQARVQFVFIHLMLVIIIISISAGVAVGPEAANLPVRNKWLTASLAFIAGLAGITISIKTTKWTLSYKIVARETIEE